MFIVNKQIKKQPKIVFVYSLQAVGHYGQVGRVAHPAVATKSNIEHGSVVNQRLIMVLASDQLSSTLRANATLEVNIPD